MLQESAVDARMLLQVTAQLDSVEPPISLTVLKKTINKNKMLDVDTKSHMFTAIHYTRGSQPFGTRVPPNNKITLRCTPLTRL